MKAQRLCAISFIISTLLPSREPTRSEAFTEGKTPWCWLRLRLQLCDFPQLRILHPLHGCFDVEQGMKLTQPSLTESTIWFPR